MQKKIIFLIVIICTIILSLITFVIKQHIKKPYIEMTYPVDTLPFCYSENGHCKIYIKIENDSIPIIFDTGATHSLFSNTQLFEKAKGKTHLYNIWGDRLAANNLYLDTILIGNTKYYQKYPYFGIKSSVNALGCDIMKSFAWKIDFIRQKIYFSKSVFPLLSTSESHKLPFVIKNNLCWATCWLNGERQDFMLDTGNPIFAHVNNHNKDADTINSKDFIYWDKVNEPSNNLVWNKSNSNIYTETYSIGNIKIDSLTLKDEIISYNVFDKSSLGLDFFQRFESVIFDFPQKRIYLGKYMGKTTTYLINLQQYINSIGLFFASSSGVVINVEKTLEHNGVSIGDTIVSINGHTLEQYKSFSKSEKNGFNAMINRFIQTEDSAAVEIKTMNGTETKICNLYRRHIVEPADSVYSYGYLNFNILFTSASHHIYRDSVSNSFYVKYIIK